jgi:hypothetical protein
VHLDAPVMVELSIDLVCGGWFFPFSRASSSLGGGMRANDESWGSAKSTVIRLSWAVHGLKKKDEEKGVFISQLLGAILTRTRVTLAPTLNP